MIWFLKLLLRSLCGRTIELSMMTSDGIFTLQPDERERKAEMSHQMNHSQIRNIFMIMSYKITQNCNRGCQFSISEERLAVNFGIWVIRIRVTGGPFHSGPFADGAVPAHNTVQHTAVILQNTQSAYILYYIVSNHWL